MAATPPGARSRVHAFARRSAAASQRRSVLGLAAAFALVGGCGGGGGGGGPEIANPLVPEAGIAGLLIAPDLDLGRLAEREPNDAAAHAYRLPPVPPRGRIEVAGNLADTSEFAGAPDGQDVLRYTCLAASELSITLDYGAVDLLSGLPTRVRLEARDASGALLDAVEGPTPLTLNASVGALEPLMLHLLVVTGNPNWVLTIAADDAVAPTSALRVGPATPTVIALPAEAPCPDCSLEHVLVRLKPGVDARAWALAHGHTLGEPTALGTCRVLVPGSSPDVPGSARALVASKALAEDSDVAWSEPDWRVQPLGSSIDADLARQWNLDAIGARHAWDVTRGSEQVVVGVIDSGLTSHPDLEGQVVSGYDFISDPGISRDGNGRDVDPTDLGDLGAASRLSTWHGTHVAAIIAGRGDDGVGVSGVAPGCRVMPLRTLGRGGGLVSDVADAVLFAAGLHTTSTGRRLSSPLRVVNLSLGTSAFSQELADACDAAMARSVLLVAATGNDGGPPLYPAAFPSVLAVGAVDGLLRGTAYSNLGSKVSLCAPGGFSLADAQGDGWPDGVLSAGRDETTVPARDAGMYLTGTSQAAPHVAAVAALVLSIDPSLTPTEVRELLEQTALDRGAAGHDSRHGHGLVQANAALKLALEGLGTPLTTPARLQLPIPTLRFVGLESQRRIPLVNSGGGTLDVSSVQAITDDGGGWLGATLIDNYPGANVSAAELDVIVDRTRLPVAAGWASGTLRLVGSSGGLGLVRVTVASILWPRAGAPLRVVAIDPGSGGVMSDATAHPQNEYRYVLGGLAAGAFLLRAGEDLDGDGFFCESSELCGWSGGPTEQDALPVEFPGGVRFLGQDVTVRLPTPP